MLVLYGTVGPRVSFSPPPYLENQIKVGNETCNMYVPVWYKRKAIKKHFLPGIHILCFG